MKSVNIVGLIARLIIVNNVKATYEMPIFFVLESSVT